MNVDPTTSRFHRKFSYSLCDNIVTCSKSNPKTRKGQRKTVALKVAYALEELVFKSHIRLRLETNASTENIGQSRSLLCQSIDHRSARRSQRSL